jgi:hypothetical protein
LLQLGTRSSVFIVDLQSLCRQPPAGKGYEVCVCDCACMSWCVRSLQ